MDSAQFGIAQFGLASFGYSPTIKSGFPSLEMITKPNVITISTKQNVASLISTRKETAILQSNTQDINAF